jgi:hypothetical protein
VKLSWSEPFDMAPHPKTVWMMMMMMNANLCAPKGSTPVRRL